MRIERMLGLAMGLVACANPWAASSQPSPVDLAATVAAQNYLGDFAGDVVLTDCPQDSPMVRALVDAFAAQALEIEVRSELVLVWDSKIRECGDAVLDAWYFEGLTETATAGPVGLWSYVSAVPAIVPVGFEEDLWSVITAAGIDVEARHSLATAVSEALSPQPRRDLFFARFDQPNVPHDWISREADTLYAELGSSYVQDALAALPGVDPSLATLLVTPLISRVADGRIDSAHPDVVAVRAVIDEIPALRWASVALGADVPSIVPTDSTSVTVRSDTYLKRGTPNKNQGTEEILRIRSSGNNRALVVVDDGVLASINGLVFVARLEFDIVFNANNWGTDGRTIDAHRMLVPWTHFGATWNCADDSDPSDGGPDCDTGAWEMRTLDPTPFDPDPSGTILITGNLVGTVSIDVTDDVVAMIAGDVANHGWILKKTNEGQPGHIQIGSSETGSGPRLVIQTGG